MVREKSKALILDFDGVVVDSEVIALAELQACLAEFGIELQLGEMIARFLGGLVRGYRGIRARHHLPHAGRLLSGRMVRAAV